MTAPSFISAVAGEQLIIEIETTPGGGTYGAPLTINLDRNLDVTANADETMIPRSDNPSAPGYMARVVTSTDWVISGSGVLNSGDDFTYITMLMTGLARSVRVSNTTVGGAVCVGQAVLTGFKPSGGGIGKKVQATIEIKGAGPLTVTAHT